MQRSLLISFFLFVSAQFSFSQEFSQEDLALLRSADFGSQSIVYIKRPFLITGNNIFAKYNPIKLLASSSMYLYQNVISQQLNSNCPYHYSCSDFSKRCIAQHGFIKGVLLTGDRLTRCTSFGLRDVKLKSDINLNTLKIIDQPDYYH